MVKMYVTTNPTPYGKVETEVRFENVTEQENEIFS
jgi:hypothetical protein